MTMIPSFRRAAFAGAVVTACLAMAGNAVAAPYEQVDRAGGAFADAPLLGASAQPAAVGDLGRYAGFNRSVSVPNGDPRIEGYVRDIQTNTTIDYGGGVRRIYGIDRAEKRALILRTRSGKFQVVVVPIAGGAPIIVLERAISPIEPEAALTGDGRKVAVSETYGSWLIDVTGGTPTVAATLTHGGLYFTPNGLSDTGSVVVARSRDGGGWVRIRTTGTDTMPRPLADVVTAAVDAAGTTVAYATWEQVVIQNLTAKTEQRAPLPWNVGGVLWVGDRGSKVVVGKSGGYATPARTFTPATGAWANYGERFARWISGDSWNPTPISANGRFALFGGYGMGSPVVLADTTGAHITGANEGLAAAAYLRTGIAVERCTEPAEFSLQMIAPNYAPAPTKAEITVKLGTTVVAAGTLTQSTPSDVYEPLGEGPDWIVEGTFPSASTAELVVTAKVTDGAGRVLTGTWPWPHDTCW